MYTELFCVHAVTSVSFYTCESFLGDSLEFNQANQAPYVLEGDTELLCMQCRGIGPHLVVRGKCHGFSRVAGGTWGILSSYGGNGHSKLVFVQRRQDSCLVMRDTSGIPTRLGRTIRMFLEVRRETECPFLVATVILGFLSIFHKSRASSPFEAVNSAFLLRYQRDVRSPVQMRRGPRAFSRLSTGD